MLASDLWRTGVGLKLSQLKLAIQSYVRDRTNQTKGTVGSYAVAAGLFAGAGIFLISACLVGLFALFRWIEIQYGQFWAFGAIGALLTAVAAICAGLAAAQLKRSPPDFPSLTSRLRVAIKANPLGPNQIDAARNTAAAVLQATSSPPTGTDDNRRRPLSDRDYRQLRAGLVLTATLLGWAATRRRQLARQRAGA